MEHLTLFHTTLCQELIKRTLQTLSDEEIQTMADAIEHQIEKLTGLHPATIWSAPAERSGDGALVHTAAPAESTTVQPFACPSSKLLSTKEDAWTKDGKEKC